MRAILWLSVLCGVALATPARQRRSDGEQQKAAEHPGISPVEDNLPENRALSLMDFLRTMRNIVKRVEFAEQLMKEFPDKAAADFSDITENPRKLIGLAGKWHHLKYTILSTLNSVAHNLGLMGFHLYTGHTVGFDETRRCDHLKELVDAEGGEPTMKKLVEGIRKTTKCFVDVLKEASQPGKIDCDSITERQAMDMAFHLVESLHPLKLNGHRVLESAEKILEALKSKQESQESSLGGDGGSKDTPDKRIVELLRRYLEMKRGHGGQGPGNKPGGGHDKPGGGHDKPGGGHDKPGGGQGDGGGQSGSGQGGGDSGTSSGESSSEVYDNKDAKQEGPVPYPCEVFSQNIADLIQIVLKNVNRFQKIVDDMGQQGLTDEKLEELKTKWQHEMYMAGHDIDLTMLHLVHIISRLYRNNDTNEIKEVNLCNELKIVTFSGTVTDGKDKEQVEAFIDALVKTVRDDAICIQVEVDEEAVLKKRLDDFQGSLPEVEALRLIQDFFQHLHIAKMNFDRFFRHIERAVQPLVKAIMEANTEKRELREMESELAQLMKKELAADS